MNKKQNPEAAETVQTTSVPAVDLPRLVRLEDVPAENWDFNDWGKWGDGNWHFYDGNEMEGHVCIASVAPNPGHKPHWNGKAWEWKPNHGAMTLP